MQKPDDVSLKVLLLLQLIYATMGWQHLVMTLTGCMLAIEDITL
jgi:hypothetical protein